MNLLAIIFAVLFFVMTALALFTTIRLSKERRRASESDARALALEAKLAQGAPRGSERKEKAQPQKPKAPEANSELLDLRREVARLRDENRTLAKDIKTRDRELTEAREGVESKLYVLQEEKRRLLEIVKEQDARIASQVKFDDMPEVRELRAELDRKRRDAETERQRATDLERAGKPLREQLASLQDKLSDQQKELARWREAAQLANGKPLDPALFVRWFRRAQAARESYQMMKRVRELSEHKVELYQDSILRLAKYVLEKSDRPAPEIRPGDVVADRWLGEALSALAAQGHAPLESNEEFEASAH